MMESLLAAMRTIKSEQKITNRKEGDRKIPKPTDNSRPVRMGSRTRGGGVRRERGETGYRVRGIGPRAPLAEEGKIFTTKHEKRMKRRGGEIGSSLSGNVRQCDVARANMGLIGGVDMQGEIQQYGMGNNKCMGKVRVGRRMVYAEAITRKREDTPVNSTLPICESNSGHGRKDR